MGGASTALTTRARLRYYSPELGVTVLRGFGWVARCDCGERFPARKDRAAAREDKRRHVCASEPGD